MIKIAIRAFAAVWSIAIVANVATAAEKPVAPPRNPFLAQTTYPGTHAYANFTPLAGPVGPSRRIRADEYRFRPLAPFNGYIVLYSEPYPDGRQVLWTGGYDRITKLDAATLDMMADYAIDSGPATTEAQDLNYLDTMDKLEAQGDLQAMRELGNRTFKRSFSDGIGTWYHLLSSDNEVYVARQPAGSQLTLRVYGDADPGKSDSPIAMKREWKVPPDVAKGTSIGLGMTYDGHVALITTDGVLIVISRDLREVSHVRLPRSHEEGADSDLYNFNTFVRNSIAFDERGGIYVVTREALHRVQWTGKKLSLDEADGAWQAPYNNEKTIGSGTTPGLMGWGPKEDHLVVIADAARRNNAVAYWRDAIPKDWKGLPGYPRRVAGVTPIGWGISDDEKVQVENSPVVFGYGAFYNNTFPQKTVPEFEGKPYSFDRWMAESFMMNIAGHEAAGGTVVRWQPQTRTFETAWRSQANFVSSLCNISAANGILYCMGARNRDWTIDGIDWRTGKLVFTYTLGSDQRFNPLGGPIKVAPNGALIAGTPIGVLRVQPNAAGVVR